MIFKNNKINSKIRELIEQDEDCDCTIDRMGFGEGDVEGVVKLVLDEVERIIDASDPSVKCVRHEPYRTIIQTIHDEFGVS